MIQTWDLSYRSRSCWPSAVVAWLSATVEAAAGTTPWLSSVMSSHFVRTSPRSQVTGVTDWWSNEQSICTLDKQINNFRAALKVKQQCQAANETQDREFIYHTKLSADFKYQPVLANS